MVTCAESVYAHVELAASEEKWVDQVALTDVGFGRVVSVEGFPAGDVGDAAEDEDAFSLAFRGLGVGIGTGFMIQSARLSFCVLLNSS